MINIPKDKSTDLRAQVKKSKKCNYPGCNEEFLGTGGARYCLKHRDKKYHKELYFDKYKQEEKNNTLNDNQIIENESPGKKIIKCALDGCNNEFEIIVMKDIKIYPKFCEQHRNEYRRNLFLKRGITNAGYNNVQGQKMPDESKLLSFYS